jgi:hypothetical protein
VLEALAAVSKRRELLLWRGVVQLVHREVVSDGGDETERRHVGERVQLHHTADAREVGGVGQSEDGLVRVKRVERARVGERGVYARVGVRLFGRPVEERSLGSTARCGHATESGEVVEDVDQVLRDPAALAQKALQAATVDRADVTADGLDVARERVDLGAGDHHASMHEAAHADTAFAGVQSETDALADIEHNLEQGEQRLV